MVLRRVSSGGPSASFARSRALLLAAALVVAGLPAQEGTPPVTPPEPQSAPAFGRVVVDQAPLRCWSGAVASPPVFEESLAKDQVVPVGRSENGFRAVQLPLGPLGYVSRKFVEAGEDGKVKTKGTKVAFRYRPRASEAPVAQLADGTELLVVAEQDDWYQVRVPGVDAWVAEAEIQLIESADAAVTAAVDELRARHQAQIQARLDQIAAAIARKKQDEADLAAVQLIEEAFAAERRKPIAEQAYNGLDEALDKLLPTLAADSAGRPAIEAMRKRIQTQRWIAEATAVRDSAPPPVEPLPPQPKDPLERFQSIGWLRYERRLAGPGVFYLEKGGQRQYLLSCNTGRYDLSLLVDREVGVIGPRRRPVTESLSVLDVERVEVLGTPAR